MAPSDRLIVAAQRDGLGGRLVTMSTAKMLANRTGLRFGFLWNVRAVDDKQTHFIDVASKMFDKAFIDQYWVGVRPGRRGFGQLDDAPFSIDDLRTESRRSSRRGWTCQLGAYSQITPSDGQLDADRSKAFHEIVFASHMRQVVDRADAATLPKNVVALHLRAGDIVYGGFRNRPRFWPKVIPAPLAVNLIAKFKERGDEVLLFGEDEERLKQLSALTGCGLVENFGAPPRWAFTERAFFEFALMSRCREICGGYSSFNRLASIRNLAPIVDPLRLYAPAEIKDVIVDELRRNEAAYRPREAAFGYLFAAFASAAAPREQAALLQEGFRLDPENSLYPLKLASLAFAEGRNEDGEAILGRALPARSRSDRRRARSILHPLTLHDAPLDWKDDIAHFRGAAKSGQANAAACCALYFARYGDPAEAREFARAALKADRGNLIFRRIAMTVELRALRRLGGRIGTLFRSRRPRRAAI